MNLSLFSILIHYVSTSVGHLVQIGGGQQIRFNICGHLSPLKSNREEFEESQKVNCYISPIGSKEEGHICGRDPIQLNLKNNNRTSDFDSFLLLHFMNGIMLSVRIQ